MIHHWGPYGRRFVAARSRSERPSYDGTLHTIVYAATSQIMCYLQTIEVHIYAWPHAAAIPQGYRGPGSSPSVSRANTPSPRSSCQRAPHLFGGRAHRVPPLLGAARPCLRVAERRKRHATVAACAHAGDGRELAEHRRTRAKRLGPRRADEVRLVQEEVDGLQLAGSQYSAVRWESERENEEWNARVWTACGIWRRPCVRRRA